MTEPGATDGLPERIGRYRVEAVLGRGAMGVIYRAEDPEIGRKVAIKLISTLLLSGADREEYLARFRREAQAAGRCLHPNVVAVHDFAMHEGEPFLVMEHVDGIDLRRALDDGRRFAVAATAALVLQILDGLGAAHALGTVHRDIKPANVLLLPDGRAKLADFGIARIVGADLTAPDRVIGTPGYMAPEQWRGEPADAQTDLFATGALLYEMLSGERAFPGKSQAEIVQRVLNADPAPLPAAIAAAAPGMAVVLARALAKRREDRFASAQDMADALRRAVAMAPDATVVAAASRAGGLAIGAMLTQSLERSLQSHVGPIARVLVQNALRTASSPEMLCASLAASIAEPSERRRFERESLSKLREGSGSGRAVAPGRVTAEELERAQRVLTRFLGPIARVLVRRAAATAATGEALWDALAAYIEDEDERAAFRREHAPDA